MRNFTQHWKCAVKKTWNIKKKTMPFEFNYTLLHFYYICKFLFAQWNLFKCNKNNEKKIKKMKIPNFKQLNWNNKKKEDKKALPMSITSLDFENENVRLCKGVFKITQRIYNWFIIHMYTIYIIYYYFYILCILFKLQLKV